MVSGAFIGELILWIIVAVIVIAVVYWVMQYLYRRSMKEVAFVRTSFLGQKVVIDGGAFVWPIIHDITPVNMNTLPLKLERTRQDALISKDRTRIDMQAEFYVRVRPTRRRWRPPPPRSDAAPSSRSGCTPCSPASSRALSGPSPPR